MTTYYRAVLVYEGEWFPIGPIMKVKEFVIANIEGYREQSPAKGLGKAEFIIVQ